MFTPEELAEMARADAEIEASFCLTNEELKQSREIDRDVVVGRMDRDTRRRAEYQKAYREANRDKVAEYQKAIADARKARKWTQKELAQRLGISRSLVAQWEVGIAPANWELIFDALPELKEVSA